MTSSIQTAAATMAKRRHDKSQLNMIIKPLAEKLYSETKSENHADYQAIVSDLINRKLIERRKNPNWEILDERTLKKWLIEWQEKEHRSK